MILYETGKAYWTIAQRFHAHRDNPTMRVTAVREMNELLPATKSEAVQRRITSFVSRNQLRRKPLGFNPPPTVA